jgi:hypothetical protein
MHSFNKLVVARKVALMLVAGIACRPAFADSDGWSWKSPAQILIIRHAEKPETGDDLSTEGYARAKALVGVFTTDYQNFGPLAAIYAMAPKESDEGTERPIETVTPLVEALKAHDPQLVFDKHFTKPQTQEAALDALGKVEFFGKTVLFCWERKTIMDLLTAFGVKTLPAKWPKDSFGRVYVLSFNQDGSFKSLQCREELSTDSGECDDVAR